MNSFAASNVDEKHSALVNNIGTYKEEGEAFELLNNLRVLVPTIVLIVTVLDALLAAVYLKCLHPWKILLQEVSSFSFSFLSFTLLHLRYQTFGSLRMTQEQSRPMRWYFIIFYLSL